MADPVPPRLRVLVTNDDGVHAVGLHHLAAAMVEAGHDVVVAAPQTDMSGSGAAIGRLHPDEHIDVMTHPIPGAHGLEAFAVDGPPALAVLTARLGAFGEPPHVVVAGINPGHNTGRATLHSGTVGAALTAANFGGRGVAVSLGVSEAPHWGTAAALAAAAVEWTAGAPERTVLNLNVPDLPLEDLRGVRWAELAAFGTVRAAVVGAEDGRLQMELRETGEVLPPDSDTALVQAGFVAVTSLIGITADPAAPEMTAPAADELDAWLLQRSA
jgi:5'-nucleotidase